MRKKIIFCLWLISIAFGLAVIVYGAATTTNTVTRPSYYGRESSVKKLVFTVAPVAADDNSVFTSVASDETVAGFLRRVTLDASGTDAAFSVIVKDSDEITLYEKSDCSTSAMPVSYVLDYPGIPVAGALTLDVNGVDPNNLTAVTVALYYSDP